MAVVKRPSTEHVDHGATDDDAILSEDEDDESVRMWEAWGLDPDLSQVTTREDVVRDTYSRSRRDALMRKLSE